MSEPTPNAHPIALSSLLSQLAGLLPPRDERLDESTPIGRATAEFFVSNWESARTGLLARTEKLRVMPRSLPAPRVFQFQLDSTYKRKVSSTAPVELIEGTLEGTIYYRTNIYTPPAGQPPVTVFIDPELHLYHPNFARSHGVLCTGDLPPGPFPLTALLEHLYGILTYQNVSTTDPADLEASLYFAQDPGAMRGLEAVEPLTS